MTTTRPPGIYDIPAANCIIASSREEWLQNRRLVIGASDSAALIGEGYAGQSAATVWESKVSDVQTEFDAKMAKRLRIGQLIEPALRAILQEETGWPVVNPPEFSIYRHEDIEWLGASLDSIVEHPEYGPIPGELKNVGKFAAWEWDHDQIPLKFQIQLQHQMFVTGASHGIVMGLLDGCDPRWQVCERNDAFIGAIMPKWQAFWASVLSRECPIDGSEGSAQVLSRLFPRDSGATVPLAGDAMEWDQVYLESKATIKAAEKRLLEAENQIKAAIGEASEGLLPNGQRYTWRLQSRKESVSKACEFRVLRRAKQGSK